MRRLPLALAVVAMSAGVLIPAAIAFADAPAGQVGIRLLEAPVDRANDPRAAGAIIDHLTPGTTITRRIEVSSGLDEPVTLSLYAAGAAVSGGTFQFLDGRAANDVASWTTVSPASVTLAPRSRAVAVVTVTIPGDVVAGERYAVVWAELPAATSKGVSVVNRVGIRLYLSVGAGGEPPTDFVIESLTAGRTQDGNPTVVAKVRNTGQRALDLRGELRLGDGPGGLSAGPFPVQLGTTIGVGQSADVVTQLDRAIPNGPWEAAMTLKSGLVERSATARIRFPAAGFAKPVRAQGARSWVPLVAASALVLLVGLFMVLFLRRRHEERRDLAAQPKPNVVAFPARAPVAVRRPAAGPYARQAVASKGRSNGGKPSSSGAQRRDASAGRPSGSSRSGGSRGSGGRRGF